MAKIEVQTSGPEPRKKVRGPGDPLVALWKRRLELAEKRLKKAGGCTTGKGEWQDLIRLYEGDQWEHSLKNPRQWHKITSNLIKANVDVLRPQLYFKIPTVRISVKNPYVLPEDVPEMTIDPMTGQPVPRMKQVPAPPPPAPPQGPPGGPPLPGPPPPGPPGPPQGMPPGPPPMMEVPVVKFPKGTAVAKVGGNWVDATEQCKLLEQIDNYYLNEMDFSSEIRRIILQALIIGYGVGKLEWVVKVRKEEIPTYSEPDGEQTGTTTEDRIVHEGPRFRLVNPWMFLVDPELEVFDLNRARWVAEVFYASKEDLESDPNLKHIDRIGKARFMLDEGTEGLLEEPTDEEREHFARYKVYEIHDLEHDRLIVWVEGSDKFQRFEDNPYSMVEGSVYTLLGYEERPDDFYPMSLVEQMKTKQQAYNFLLSYMVNHVRRFNRKYWIQRQSLDPDERTKLEDGADGCIIEVDGNPPSPIADAPISSDMYNVKDVLKRELTEETGVSSMNRASREPGVNTAYEAQQIQSGADSKVSEKQDMVRIFIRSVVRKLNQILKVYADRDQAIRIAGPKGAHWQSWTKEDIQGEFIEDVDIYSSMPYSEETDRKQAMELYSIIQQNPQIDQFATLQWLFRKFNAPENLLLPPEEVRQKLEQMTAKELQILQDQGAAMNTGLRPSEGDVQRPSDMVAGIMGPPQNFQ